MYTPPEGYLEKSSMQKSEGQYVSDNLGRFYLGYLPLGTYYLVETKTLSGYNILAGPVILTVEQNSVVYSLPGRAENIQLSVDNKDYYNLYIDNNPGVELPATGGSGTDLFYLLGAVLTLGAGSPLVMRKKKYTDAS